MNTSSRLLKRPFILAQLILIALVSISAVNAQTGSVDSSFNPLISKNSGFSSFTLLPDGKILVYGGFQIVKGVLKNRIARLNADGSLDNSFDCAACDFNIESALAQPDGKIVIAGFLNSALYSTSEARVKRLNSDGSLDASFNSPFNNAAIPQRSTSATLQAIQPDGKVLVTISFYAGGTVGVSLYRLNADGTTDTSFAIINFVSGRAQYEDVGKVFVLPSGKFLISINYVSFNPGAGIRRYNSDGTRDSTFESPTFTGNLGMFQTGSQLSDFEVLIDGSIIIVGSFNTVNAVSRVNIAKLQPAGNVDLSFAPPNTFQTFEGLSAVEIFSNGKILVRTYNIAINPAIPRFILYNADGSVNDTFIPPANLIAVGKFIIDAADNVFFYGGFTENNQTVNKFARLNMNGTLISSSAAQIYGIGGTVTNLRIQTDGKIIIIGDFTRVNNTPKNNFARLNADGSLDETFNTGTGFGGTADKILVQPDGKILIGGIFTTYNGTARNNLVRLNADGTLDAGFNANFTGGEAIRSIDLQTDGKILVGGLLSSIGGQARNGLARLNSDGSLDAAFNPLIGNSSGVATVYRVLAQLDGKILIGGAFNAVNGFSRPNLVRLNGDGTLDSTFNAGSIGVVFLAESYPGGKYLISNGANIVRLNNDGTADNTFQTPTANDIFNALLVQTDGSVIVVGNFTAIGNILRSRLARLRVDGSVDAAFFPNGADNGIRAVVRQTDSKIIVGGSFTKIENVTRLGIARLNVAPLRARPTLYDFDGDGKADVSVFRPSNGTWYILGSGNNAFSAVQFGLPGDLIAPADYDGDGRADLAVFRENVAGGGKGFFYILNSADNSFRPAQFGQTGDVPISGDWDGDGIGDLAVYRDGSLTGASSYFLYRPSSAPGVDFRLIPWGAAGDKPVVGDYDGDGKFDAAIWRPSISQWYILRSSNNQFFNVQFGQVSDLLTPADYNGDGITDVGVFRPSNGTWYYSSSQTTPSTIFTAIQFGQTGDLPTPADYDGDGKADVAVFHPSNGIWYLNRTTQGFTGIQFGASGDKPAPNAYVR